MSINLSAPVPINRDHQFRHVRNEKKFDVSDTTVAHLHLKRATNLAAFFPFASKNFICIAAQLKIHGIHHG
jgi:hypothetical protein